jgi:ornithine cyclodeaminase
LADRINDLTEECGLIYLATPSTKALFDSTCIQAGTHIVAIGADSPGKQELDAEVYGRAARIATDDHHQCLDHGDFGNAVRAGVIPDIADVSFGDILAGKVAGRTSNEDITIVDITGIPALDIAIATLFCDRLGIKQA